MIQKRLSFTGILLLAILFSAPMAQAKTPVAAENLIRAGDQLTITIYPEDDYLRGGKMQVSEEGFITLPLIGKVEVAGKTSEEARQAIASSVGSGYLVNPVIVLER